jgi:uncharacterized membrane protein YsdA (DUF1294 family)
MMRMSLCTTPWNTIIRLQENSLNLSNFILYVGHNFALRHHMWRIREQTQRARARARVWLLKENSSRI